MHPFDSAKYVRVEDYIATMKKDMNAELADVAYCLGAKSCKIERTEKKSRSFHIKGHNKNSGSAPLCVDGVPVQGSLEDREKASFGYAMKTNGMNPSSRPLLVRRKRLFRNCAGIRTTAQSTS